MSHLLFDLCLVTVPTWECLNKCSYCDIKTGKHEINYYDGCMKIDRELTVDEWHKGIDSLVKGRNYMFDVCGGEPLLYKELPALLKDLPGVHNWAMTTSLQADVPDLDYTFCNSVTTSYHYGDKKVFLKRFEKIRHQMGQRATIALVVTPWNLDMFFKSYKYFNDLLPYNPLNVHVMYKPNFDWNDYMDEKIWLNSFLTENDNEWHSRIFKHDEYKWDKCWAGRDYFFIHSNGETHRCQTHFTHGLSTLGNIMTKVKTPTLNCGMSCAFSCDWQRSKKEGRIDG